MATTIRRDLGIESIQTAAFALPIRHHIQPPGLPEITSSSAQRPTSTGGDPVKEVGTVRAMASAVEVAAEQTRYRRGGVK